MQGGAVQLRVLQLVVVSLAGYHVSVGVDVPAAQGKFTQAYRQTTTASSSDLAGEAMYRS